MDYPVCKWCGHEFSFKFNCFDGSGAIHLEKEWANARNFGGEYTRTATCPVCGKPCEIGYKCVMKPISRKAKVVS